MKRLSVCMIVKDEEKLLPRCLDSIKGIADEIIIVDTGSTDRTKQIANEYDVKLFDYTWSNDFSAARNESLRYATGKWVLVLDADEYLAEDDHDKWIAFLNHEKPVAHIAYTIPIINFTGNKDYQDEITTAPVTRLFPNHKGIQFERPIHEQLTRGRLGKLYHKKISLNIYHTGYQTQRVTEKNKHERNMSIFSEMKKNQDLSDYDWFTLGNQYRYAKDETEALHCYEQALLGADIDSAWYPHCLLGVISLYFKRNQLKQSWEWTEDRLSRYKEFSEYHTIKGIQYETMGFFEQAADCYHEAIKVAEHRANNNQEIWLVDPMYSFETPAQQLVEIHFRLNDNQQAIHWLSKLLHKNNKNPKVLLKLLEWLCQNENPESVIGFLNKYYDLDNVANCNLLFKVSLVLGQVDLVRYYEKFIPDLDDLSPLDQLRFAVLTEDKEAWLSFTIDNVDTDLENQLQLWVQAAVAALKWNGLDKLEQLSMQFNHEDVTHITALMNALFGEPQVVDEQAVKKYASLLFPVAKQLFLIKEYELFDKFIQVMQTSELINQLANYFYSLNLTDMAMNYYSILLSQKQLDVSSLINLGMFHANQGYHEDAVEFLSEAVKKEPAAKQLYYLLITQASGDQKLEYVQMFIKECPTYKDISFVRDFLNEEKIIS